MGDLITLISIMKKMMKGIRPPLLAGHTPLLLKAKVGMHSLGIRMKKN